MSGGSSLQQSAPRETSLDPRPLEQLSRVRGINPGFVRDMVSLFIAEASVRAHQVVGHIDAGHASGAAAAAHGLLGSAATFGATRLAELCRQVEDLCRAGDLAAARSPAMALLEEVAAVSAELANRC